MINNMSVDRYKEIKKLDDEFNQVNISTHIPSLTDTDYKRGYITRYFLQKSNDKGGVIYEIKKNSISKFKNNSFYLITNLDWKIIGEPIEVKKSNSASIKLASTDIPKIGLYLPNLLQFHKK